MSLRSAKIGYLEYPGYINHVAYLRRRKMAHIMCAVCFGLAGMLLVEIYVLVKAFS